MHIEFLVEDSSGRELLQILLPLLPMLLGEQGNPHTWRAHPYKGIGRLPRNSLTPGTDPAKRILLDQLPRILRGLGNTPGVDAIVIVLDVDTRDCVSFLTELKDLSKLCAAWNKRLFSDWQLKNLKLGISATSPPSSQHIRVQSET